jgi:hypothetical protein
MVPPLKIRYNGFKWIDLNSERTDKNKEDFCGY